MSSKEMMYGRRCNRRFFMQQPEILARELLDCLLVRQLDNGTRLAGIIVETEAYLGADDEASHTYGGKRTPRNESMWQVPGTAYVYFTYGMHHCVNVSAGPIGESNAVLIRALKPIENIETMTQLRQHHRTGRNERRLKLTDLCSGPAKLCQALAIDRTLDGTDMVNPESPIWIEQRKTGRLTDGEVVVGPRVGLSNAGPWTDKPLRYAMADCACVSRPKL